MWELLFPPAYFWGSYSPCSKTFPLSPHCIPSLQVPNPQWWPPVYSSQPPPAFWTHLLTHSPVATSPPPPGSRGAPMPSAACAPQPESEQEPQDPSRRQGGCKYSSNFVPAALFLTQMFFKARGLSRHCSVFLKDKTHPEEITPNLCSKHGSIFDRSHRNLGKGVSAAIVSSTQGKQEGT